MGNSKFWIYRLLRHICGVPPTLTQEEEFLLSKKCHCEEDLKSDVVISSRPKRRDCHVATLLAMTRNKRLETPILA